MSLLSSFHIQTTTKKKQDVDIALLYDFILTIPSQFFFTFYNNLIVYNSLTLVISTLPCLLHVSRTKHKDEAEITTLYQDLFGSPLYFL